MKITALEIDGYGIWSGLKLAGLSDGLNVFYGPNEAGKTTLMQFIRSVLYGITAERRRYLPPHHGGRPGGSLSLAATSGRFQVSRYAADEPGGADIVTIAASDGTQQGEQLLKSLLVDVDERIFNNVFAVGLKELQELGALGDTEAAAMLYSLSVGLDRVPLADVIRDLDNSRNHILHREGGPCEVGRLMSEREKLRSEIGELGAATQTWGRLIAERDEIERETARLEEAHRQAEQQVRVAEIAINVQARWQDRAALDEQLAVLGPVAPVPEESIGRFDALQRRLEQCRTRIGEWQRRWGDLCAEAKQVQVDEALWRVAPRIEALQEQEGWIGTLQKRTAELETEIAELEGQLAAERRQLGLADGDSNSLPALTPRSFDSLRRPARSLSRCRRETEESQSRVATVEQAAESFAIEVEAALSARGQRDLGDAMDRLGGLVGQLRRRVQIDERIEQMESYQADLHEQSRSLLNRQVLPVWAVVGLGAVFVVGAALVALSALGWLGWIVAILGMGGAIASLAAKFIFERSSARRLSGCQKQISMLQAQIRQAREERETLDRQLPPGDGPVSARLKTAEKELASLEEVVPLDARRQAAWQEIDAAKARSAEAEQALSAAQRRWKEALSVLGLPAGFSPKQVRALTDRCDAIGETHRRLELRYEEFQQRNRELDGVTGRISRLAADARLALADKHPAEQLRQLVEQLREQETRIKRREALRGEARMLKRKRARLDATMRKLKQRRHALLRSAGARNGEDFRRRAELSAKSDSLREQRAAIQREIDAAIAGFCPEEAVGEQLDAQAKEPLEARRDQLRQRAQAAEKRLQEQFERRGRLLEQIRALTADRALAVKQLDLGMVEKRLAEAIHRWRVQAVASRILDEVRVTYERDRQPETLQEASEHLERLTQGRYRRVWTPLGENILRVDGAEGKGLAVEVLSRGTMEQLFLALRLALANSFARRGAALPMVLDDVLVNFDMDRAKAAAAVLRDFAEQGRQLFVFTCHEHIWKLFRSLKVEVRELPSRGRIEFEVLEPPKPPKRKRRRKQEEPAEEPLMEPEEEPEVEPELDPEVAEEKATILTVEEEPYEPAEEALWPADEIGEPEEPLGEPLEPEDVDQDDPDGPPEPAEEEEEEPEEDESRSHGFWADRRPRDDWDDRYEDEYDQDEMEIAGQADAQYDYAGDEDEAEAA